MDRLYGRKGFPLPGDCGVVCGFAVSFSNVLIRIL